MINFADFGQGGGFAMEMAGGYAAIAEQRNQQQFQSQVASIQSTQGFANAEIMGMQNVSSKETALFNAYTQRLSYDAALLGTVSDLFAIPHQALMACNNIKRQTNQATRQAISSAAARGVTLKSSMDQIKSFQNASYSMISDQKAQAYIAAVNTTMRGGHLAFQKVYAENKTLAEAGHAEKMAESKIKQQRADARMQEATANYMRRMANHQASMGGLGLVGKAFTSMLPLPIR